MLAEDRTSGVLTDEARLRSEAFHLASTEEDKLVPGGVSGEFDAGRAGVDDEEAGFHRAHSAAFSSAAPRRSSAANSTARAAEARRVRALSARLVRMIG